MRLLLLGMLAASLLIPSASLADLTLYDDREEFEGQGCIIENYGFEDWPAGIFSYPGTPWTVHGVTYNCTENTICGAGTGPYYPLSNVFLNNYWTPLLATVDPAPMYPMLGFEALDLTYEANPVLMNFVIYTNMGSYAYNGMWVPLCSLSIGQFYGWIADPGEFITGFEMHSTGSPHAAAIDNVTLGLQTGPSATESATWGGLKSLFE